MKGRDSDHLDAVNKMGKTKADDTKKEVRVVPPWHCMTKEEVIKELGLPPDIRRVGLTTAEAQARLEKYGENKMTEGEIESIWHKIWKLVNNMLVGILVFVAVICFIAALLKLGTPLNNWMQVGIIIGVIM
jgi:uncharacterized membrane protein